jgi:hypothetical protein
VASLVNNLYLVLECAKNLYGIEHKVFLELASSTWIYWCQWSAPLSKNAISFYCDEKLWVNEIKRDEEAHQLPELVHDKISTIDVDGWCYAFDEEAHQLPELVHDKISTIGVDGWCYAFYCFVLHLCIFVVL